MSFLRFLGGRAASKPAYERPPVATETEAVRKIVARLEALPLDQARLLAGMAFVLARAANADMEITDVETQAIETALFESGLDESQAVLVAEMAKLQERTTGGTTDFQVTREFRDAATQEQQLALLRACFQVAAAEAGISAMESGVLDEIANELDIDRGQLSAIRSDFADKFTAGLNYRPEN